VAGSGECGDEPSGSGATELVSLKIIRTLNNNETDSIGEKGQSRIFHITKHTACNRKPEGANEAAADLLQCVMFP
jgi:hypothetical protein